MLLAGLQGQPVGGVAVGVDAHADEAAGHGALEALAHGQVAGVRAAVAERDAEALAAADGDVGAELAGRGQQGEGEQVGGDGDEGAPRVRGLDDRARVADRAAARRVLQQHAEDVALGQAARQVERPAR